MSNEHVIDVAQMATTIKQYITAEFLYDRTDIALTNDFPLIEQGVIDSMGIFRLIIFLEGTFGKKLELTEIEYHNFATIEAIVALIARNIAA